MSRWLSIGLATLLLVGAAVGVYVTLGLQSGSSPSAVAPVVQVTTAPLAPTAAATAVPAVVPPTPIPPTLAPTTVPAAVQPTAIPPTAPPSTPTSAPTVP